MKKDKFFHINDCIESNLGVWQYYREIGSNIYQLQYFKLDDITPTITLNLTKGEFEDLNTLIPNIKKYKKNSNNIINSIRKATGMDKDTCTMAYENTDNMEDAIDYVKKRMSKLA